jgi:hypothetical protein
MPTRMCFTSKGFSCQFNSTATVDSAGSRAAHQVRSVLRGGKVRLRVCPSVLCHPGLSQCTRPPLACLPTVAPQNEPLEASIMSGPLLGYKTFDSTVYIYTRRKTIRSQSNLARSPRIKLKKRFYVVTLLRCPSESCDHLSCIYCIFF